jgi:hypothetical protein
MMKCIYIMNYVVVYVCVYHNNMCIRGMCIDNDSLILPSSYIYMVSEQHIVVMQSKVRLESSRLFGFRKYEKMAKSNIRISKQISFKISIYLPFLVVFLILLSKAFSIPSGALNQGRNSVSPFPPRTRQFLITFIAESEQKWRRMFVLQIFIEGSCDGTVWCTSCDDTLRARTRSRL